MAFPRAHDCEDVRGGRDKPAGLQGCTDLLSQCEAPHVACPQGRPDRALPSQGTRQSPLDASTPTHSSSALCRRLCQYGENVSIPTQPHWGEQRAECRSVLNAAGLRDTGLFRRKKRLWRRQSLLWGGEQDVLSWARAENGGVQGVQDEGRLHPGLPGWPS